MVSVTHIRPLLAVAAVAAVAGRQLYAQSDADRGPLLAISGPQSVGRSHFEWIDQSRSDSATPSHHREIVVWAWYPSNVDRESERTVWMPGKWGEVFWGEYSKGRPGLAQRPDLSAIRSHAHSEAPVASSPGKYPVLLFAPGSGTTPLDYSSIVEDLASHGYIVLGVDSPEFGRASIYSDGRIVMGHDPVERPKPGEPPPSAERALRAWEEAASTFGSDLSFALRELTARRDIPLSRAADFSRVGVFGHSLGGAAALQCAYDNPAIRAVFDIDGSPIWNARNGAISKPVMVLNAASTNLSYDAVLDGATPGAQLQLAGTVHSFPSDVRSLPFSPQPTGGSLIAPGRALRVTATLLEAFFDTYLLGQRVTRLNGPSPDLPELTFKRRPKRVP